MKLFLIWLISFLLSPNALSSQSSFPVQSQSPLVNDGPWGIELPEGLSPLQIRVLIFPHTLKRDYRHGVPDNPYKLEISSEGLIESGDQSLGKKLIFTFNKSGGLKMSANGFTRSLKNGFINLSSNKNLSLFRENNPKKIHQYIGKVEVRANEKGIFVINHIAIEDYLRGVVPNEVVKTWPMDVLKAQAVAARTYAVYHTLKGQKSSFWDVDDTARFQVFTGITHAVLKTDQSVKETEGEIMTFKNKVIKAYFHSYSGGKTASAKEIFGELGNEYCLGSDEIFEREELLKVLNPKFSWIIEWKSPQTAKSNFLTQLKMNPTLNHKFKNYDEKADIYLRAEKDDHNFNSLNKLWITQKDREEFITYKDIRSLFGYGKIPSYWFYLDQSQNNSFQFKGHGWGHHVGMSQWGAYIMSNNYNYLYKDILEHYYDGISFREIN